MSFIARLLRRWGFIRLQDYGLILTDDNRVIPAADLGHSFEPPSWCSVSVPIGFVEHTAPALPPPVQQPPVQQPRPASAPTAGEDQATVEDAAVIEDRLADDDEWQWKMALARAKAEEQSIDPPKVDQTADFAPTDFEGQHTLIDPPATAPERPAVKSRPAAVLPMRPRPTPAPAPGPLRARGTGAPPIRRTEPRPMKSIPRPRRRPRPVSDETRPDMNLADFSGEDSTADQTIPSMPATLEDTQVEIARDVVPGGATQRVPKDDKSLPRLSAILDKRSAG